MENIRYVMWDWNGTILDDLQINFEIENSLLRARGLKEMESIEKYHGVFTFPIIRFYEKMGFDLENERFEDIARDYVYAYEQRFHEAEIFEDAERVIRYLNSSGMEQIILSMTESKWLFSQVAFHGIDHLFADILGTGDIFARSKVEIAKKWMAEKGVSGDEVLFVGDTTHDFEVAQSIGCKCILVARGHNSREALMKTGAQVVDSISEIIG
ncbi:MAG: HAD family hydrolase [Clostridia bacterium]|nr:HAD family hydrolase [Clostridia bacterium]